MGTRAEKGWEPLAYSIVRTVEVVLTLSSKKWKKFSININVDEIKVEHMSIHLHTLKALRKHADKIDSFRKEKRRSVDNNDNDSGDSSSEMPFKEVQN